MCSETSQDREYVRRAFGGEIIGDGSRQIKLLVTRLGKIRDAMDMIVVSEGIDAGVVLLSEDSPTHYDPEAKCQVYDHQNFSPLGDALVSVARLASVSVPCSESVDSPA